MKKAAVVKAKGSRLLDALNYNPGIEVPGIFQPQSLWHKQDTIATKDAIDGNRNDNGSTVESTEVERNEVTNKDTPESKLTNSDGSTTNATTKNDEIRIDFATSLRNTCPCGIMCCPGGPGTDCIFGFRRRSCIRCCRNNGDKRYICKGKEKSSNCEYFKG